MDLDRVEALVTEAKKLHEGLPMWWVGPTELRRQIHLASTVLFTRSVDDQTPLTESEAAIHDEIVERLKKFGTDLMLCHLPVYLSNRMADHEAYLIVQDADYKRICVGTLPL